jgi:tetratricopeptide (TPR) repeat protein
MDAPLRTKFSTRLGLATGLLAMASLTTLSISRWHAREQFRAELRQAQQEIDRGRLAAARRRLTELDQRWPGRGDTLLPLARVERAGGKPERAVVALERVSPSDPRSVEAVELLGHLLMDLGRFAPAEALLLKALAAAPEVERSPLLLTYARLLRVEGRHSEVSDVLKAAWDHASDPPMVLQDLLFNDLEPVPADGWKLQLDAGDNQDDRVWLGRGRHALLIGRFGDAEPWLRKCLERRPDDPSVWTAILDLALTTRNPGRFWEAAGKILATRLSERETASIRARIASIGGDRSLEKRELSRLVEVEPSNSRALERLAVMAIEDGDREEADRLHRRKALIDQAKDRIRRFGIMMMLDFRSKAGELVEISATLGRPFDEQAWLLVASAAAEGRPAAGHRADSTPSPPASESTRERALAYCRAASAKAWETVSAVVRGSNSVGGPYLADRLADLRAVLPATDRRLAGELEGGQVPGPRIRFTDDAEAAGLRFTFDSGRSPMWLLPESLAGGVGLIDYDGDGWLDVYCVQGGQVVAPESAGATSPGSGSDPRGGDRLFRNRRDGTFEDATEQAGIARLVRDKGYGMGIAVGDYDNDGHSDLFLTRLDRYALLRNRGDGTFEDATERAGLSGPRENPTSAAFADLDGDGDLDLYVCHYARWDPANPPRCTNESGKPHYCDPAKYEAALDRVFRNDRGRFVDVTEEAGFTDPDGRGLGVVAADLDDDNRVELFVANDGTANFLFANKGGFRFEDTALTSGVTGGSDGGFLAGMGVAADDLDGDGRPDLVVTNLYGEGCTLYRNLGQGMFADRSAASGLLQATRYLTCFGVADLDAGNRGMLDVAIACGHVNDFRPFYPFAMPARFFQGRAGGRLADISDQAGDPWSVPRLARGLARGDLDNDGRVDLVMTVQGEPLVYLHNRTEQPGHWVTFRLEGTASNRDGVGARVTITAGGRRQVAQREGGGSYLSAPDGRLHFGLGDAAAVDRVEVRWPSGRVDRWKDLPADAGFLLREGEAVPRSLGGFRIGNARKPTETGANKIGNRQAHRGGIAPPRDRHARA